MRYRFQSILLALAGGLLLILLSGASLAKPARSIQAARDNLAALQFVDKAGDPLGRATLRLLCYATANESSPLADVWRKTDDQGFLIQPLPPGCHYLAAMQLLYEQISPKPQHGPIYQVYATSWRPGTRQLAAANGIVTLTDEWPLVLFHLLVSLEWQPSAGSPFTDQLWAGLQRASAYLYDLTEGQMAFGPVTIYTDGRYWNQADLRFRAANDYRPTAYVGGMVPSPVPYSSPMGHRTVYAPGAVTLGRFWDGQDAFNPATGNWSQPAAYRTLVHEWAHHALFLYDEYRGRSEGGGSGGGYCTCPELPSGGCSNDASAMAYHYSASEFWDAQIHGEPLICQRTDQWRFHGESDWETLAHWSSIQGLPTEWLRRPGNSLYAGPEVGLAGDLFARKPDQSQIYFPVIKKAGATSQPPVEPISPPSQELNLRLLVPGLITTELLNAFYPQVYLVNPATAVGPARILYQGTANGSRNTTDGHLGEITLLGVQPQGQLKVLAERYGTTNSSGGRFIYMGLPGELSSLGERQELVLQPDSWQASLDLSYDMVGARLTTVTVNLVSPTPLGTPPIARLCLPEASTGCPDTPPWQTLMQATGPTTWKATFSASPRAQLPDYGLIWISAPEQGELIRWFQQAGGVGPGHKGAHAPLRDGPVTMNLISSLPLAGARNRVIIMPAADYNALTAPLPPTIAGLIDMPLDLDVLLPAVDPSTTDGEVALFHRPNTSQPVPANPCHLKILYFDRQLNEWQMIAPADNNDQLNWAVGTTPLQAGIYALGWSTTPCN